MENLNVYEIQNSKQAFKLFQLGTTNKIMASHTMNRTSSRSHTIFTIRVNSVSISNIKDKI